MDETLDLTSLDEQRRLLFEAISRMENAYRGPEAQSLFQQVQGRAGGTDQPFTPEVVNALLADNADASAGSFANESDLIRQAFANAGIGGGIQTSALINSRRRSEAQTRAGRRQITSRAQLENFQAAERAQSQLQSLIQQRAQHEAMAQSAEANYRSRMHRTGTEEQVQAQTTQPQQPQQQQQQQPQQPQQPSAPSTPAMPRAPIQLGVIQPTWAPVGSQTRANQQAIYEQQKAQSQSDYNRRMQDYQANMTNWFSKWGS